LCKDHDQIQDVVKSALRLFTVVIKCLIQQDIQGSV